jgi:hypothetical protein
MLKGSIPDSAIILNIALAGYLPEEKHNRDVILSKLKRVIDLTLKYAINYASKNKITQAAPELHFLFSNLLIKENIIEDLKVLCDSKAKFIGICEKTDCVDPQDTIEILDKVSYLEKENTPFDSNKSLIYSWLCDQADFAIMIKDDEDLLLIDFLKFCKQSAVPVVSIDKIIGRPMLWTESSYYDSYNDDKLENYIHSILEVEDSCKDETQTLYEKKFLWDQWYSKYMRKNKASVDTSKPYTKDTLLDENSKISALNENAETTRKELIRHFTAFDHGAILFGDKYHASIYLRAVIPLIVTGVLAVGFYIETLLGPWSVTIPGLNLQVWSIIAGIGFFLHAALNFYMYHLSESKIIHTWHKWFVDYRFIAEKLRIAVHFIPFGIPVNFTSLKLYEQKTKCNKKVLNQLNNILKGVELPPTDFNEFSSSDCLLYLEELVNDQMEYHNNSQRRYSNIVKRLKSMGKAIFFIGFFIVLFRGCLQLFLSIFKIPGDINGKELQPMIKSFANMCALLFPAWASYFTLKLNFCNFDGLYHNDLQILAELSALKQMINDEKQKERLAYSDLYHLAKEVSTLLSGEIGEWYSQINAKKFIN